MGFFKKLGEKNIVVLGDNGCGKRSFVLQYKDGTKASNLELPEMKTISQLKKFPGVDGKVLLNFILDSSSDELIPSISHKKVNADLILILIDLSSAKAKGDLKYYTEFAERHYPGVSTLLVGSKADLKPQAATFNNLIITSAKTGSGFDRVDQQLYENLFPQNLGWFKSSEHFH